MSGRSHVGGVDIGGLLYLASLLAVAFLPLLLRRGGSPPGPPDGPSGGESCLHAGRRADV